MALLIRDAAYSYSAGTSMAQPALAGAHLEVDKGELVLVLGTTGSGKSTLLRVAAGLLEPISGVREMDGVPLSLDVARGKVGLVFQNPENQLFAETVLDDVLFGPKNLGMGPGEAHAQATEALQLVGLDPERFASRSPFSLSGGEARRAAFAGVLAMRPRYLLADEPTAGLDAGGREAIKKILLSARHDAGVVVVTHTAEEFLGEADRVVILEGGRTVWSGDASSMIDDPSPLERYGLRRPAVLEVQSLARERGLEVPGFTMDTAQAARALASAAGW